MKIPTTVTVRVIAKAGKFLGADIGGALVTVHDAQTGALLASGNTSGGSGPSNLMDVCITRLETLPTDGASSFVAVLNIDTLQRIRVTAHGPNGSLQSANTVSATQWVIPGKDITGGDGLLLEVPGMQVQIQNPPTHFEVPTQPYTVDIQANVTMMCGCPISPDTDWKPDLFDVGVFIRQLDVPCLGQSITLDQFPLKYSGTTSRFVGSWKVDPKSAPAYYEAIVYAYQPSNGNSGMDRVTFFIK